MSDVKQNYLYNGRPVYRDAKKGLNYVEVGNARVYLNAPDMDAIEPVDKKDCMPNPDLHPKKKRR